MDVIVLFFIFNGYDFVLSSNNEKTYATSGKYIYFFSWK